MSKFDDNWHKHFVPECFFDTVLLKKLLLTNRRILHKHGCNNVINEFRIHSLKDDFGVGMIDKDKKDINYLSECEIIKQEDKFTLWKHKNKPHYIIQITPPIEKWISELLNENGLNISDFGYPSEYTKLKKAIKDDIDKENDEKLGVLIKAIIDTGCKTVVSLKNILAYLKEKNYSVDINELKNV